MRALLVVLLGLAVLGELPTTTSASDETSVKYVYDGPAIARLDVPLIDGAEARPTRPTDVREASAPPSVDGRGTSTTSPRSVLATEAAGAAEGGGLQIAEGNAGHIFRDAAGHLAEDTAANRAIIQSAADNGVLVRTSPQGVQTFRQLLPDGTEAWAEVYQGQITNGGVNVTPRSP